MKRKRWMGFALVGGCSVVLLAGCGLGGWTWGVGDSGQSSGGAAVPTEDQASLPAVTTAPQAPQDDTDRLIISTQTLRYLAVTCIY